MVNVGLILRPKGQIRITRLKCLECCVNYFSFLLIQSTVRVLRYIQPKHLIDNFDEESYQLMINCAATDKHNQSVRIVSWLWPVESVQNKNRNLT